MKCSNCDLDIVEEEIKNHTCFNGKIKKMVFDSDSPNLMKVFDGENWHICPTVFDRNEIRRRFDRT